MQCIDRIDTYHRAKEYKENVISSLSPLSLKNYESAAHLRILAVSERALTQDVTSHEILAHRWIIAEICCYWEQRYVQAFTELAYTHSMGLLIGELRSLAEIIWHENEGLAPQYRDTQVTQLIEALGLQ